MTSTVNTKPGGTFVVLMVAVTVFALLQAMVIPVIPEIQHVLRTDARSVAWVVSGYLLAAAVATPIIGRLGDVHGKKRVLVVVLIVLALASLLAAFAATLQVMVVARVLQGCGGAVMPLSLGIVRDESPAGRAPGAIGVLAALGGIGASVGVIIAGPLIDVFGFRALFLVPAAMAGLTTIGAILVVPARPGRGEAVSWLPAPFLAAALALFVLATTNATAWGWASPKTIGMYALAVLFGLGWIASEHRVRHPLIDLAMLARPAVRAANLVSLLLGAVMFGAYAYLPQLFQTPREAGYGFGASVTQSGLAMLPMTLTVFAGGLIAARLVALRGPRPVVIMASLAMAVTLLAIALLHESLWTIIALLTVYGAALGINIAALATLVVVSVPLAQSAVASGVNFNLRNMGGAIGAAVMATVVTGQMSSAGWPVEAGYRTGFALLAGAGLLAAGLAATIPGTPRTSTGGVLPK